MRETANTLALQRRLKRSIENLEQMDPDNDLLGEYRAMNARILRDILLFRSSAELTLSLASTKAERKAAAEYLHRADLLEILDDRLNARSTVICSRLPVDTWHAYLGEPTLADAILDRIAHHSHRIELKTKGESLRESLPPTPPPLRNGSRWRGISVHFGRNTHSQGIVIPKPLPAQVGLEGHAEMTIERDALVLGRPARAARAGWAAAAKNFADHDDDALVMGEFGNEVDAELSW